MKTKETFGPPLVEGERVQCRDTGTIYRVGRVSDCSATITEELVRPKTVTIVDKVTGEERSFEAHGGSRPIQVSPHSMLRRLS